MPKKDYDVLIPLARQNPDWESRKAEELFNKLIKEEFSYEELSNHPDWLSLASAKLLKDLFPRIVEEMLRRKDTNNFLIYPMISAIDPLSHSEYPSYEERTWKLISLADKSFSESACKFLEAMRPDPPNGEEQVQRLLSFWKEKLEELS